MRHRVRAAALILRSSSNNDSRTNAKTAEILLVKHRHPSESDQHIWLPPGGGLESQDASIFACAQREALEETGLQITPSHIAYIHEFIDQLQQIRHVAFYMAIASYSGTMSLDYLPLEEPEPLMALLEPMWVLRGKLPDLNLYPTYLKTDEFWDDATQGFTQTRYLDPMTSF